jgi:hypothetical protein
MPLFENNTFLPILIEFWIYDCNDSINFYKKKTLKLDGLVVKPFSKTNFNSINNEFYISSLFEKSDIENIKIWNDNNLLNQMICYITEPNNIILKSKIFECTYLFKNNISNYSIKYLPNI